VLLISLWCARCETNQLQRLLITNALDVHAGLCKDNIGSLYSTFADLPTKARLLESQACGNPCTASNVAAAYLETLELLLFLFHCSRMSRLDLSICKEDDSDEEVKQHEDE
jgi:hypothetical protein